MRIFVVTLLLVFLAIPVRGETADYLDPHEAFQLWTGCEPVGLYVILDMDDTEIDLTEEEIERAARSRLRSARLYDKEAEALNLFVIVNVFDVAFTTDVEFEKSLSDLRFSEEEWWGVTWATGYIGVHGDLSNYILSAVSQSMDEFLDDYLRVNADSC